MLVAEKRGDPVVAVMVWYKVGSKDEREFEPGVSHFLEHMMFKGSARFGKGMVDRVTTELGGQNNAFTSYDHTAYWFELASDRWERALDIEADGFDELSALFIEVAGEVGGARRQPIEKLSALFVEASGKAQGARLDALEKLAAARAKTFGKGARPLLDAVEDDARRLVETAGEGCGTRFEALRQHHRAGVETFEQGLRADVEIFGEGETPDDASATAAAASIKKLIASYSGNVGINFLTGNLAGRVLGNIEVKPSGPLVRLHLTLTAAEVREIVSFAAGYTGVQK